MSIDKNTCDQLRSFVERVERLTTEKDEIASDIRDVYAEAKSSGFDVPALKAIVKLRKIDADQRREQEAILETYMHALGMLFDTPLGRAAVERETKVTIEAGGTKIETSSGALKHAAEKMKTPEGKRAMRRAAMTASDTERAASLVNPQHLPAADTVKAIADRAEARSQSSTSATPPGGADMGNADGLDIPPFLSRKADDATQQARPP